MDIGFEPTWENAKNILVVRLDTMGDVLMTSPAIRALKESAPGRCITLLTSSNGAAIASLIPEIDNVIVYDAPWMKATRPNTGSHNEYKMAAKLQQAGFDAAVIFTVFTQNPLPAAFMCYLANIPLRLAHCRENPYQLLTHWVKDGEPLDGERHEVRRQLDLVASVGCITKDERLSLKPPQMAARLVERRLASAGVNLARPWLAIHPGASAASRRYPPEHFASVAGTLAGEHGIQVVFTGSKEELPLVKSIQKQMDAPSYSLAGKLDLGEMAALLGLAPLLISNNTGPVHMAAAMGTPVVDIYALTNPQHTPWMAPSRVITHDVPCKNCFKSICPEGHHDCLRKITPLEVVQAVCELLVEAAAPFQMKDCQVSL